MDKQYISKTDLLTAMAILIAVAALYWPGLHSGFYLDDLSNLEALSKAGTPDGMLNFIFNNETVRYLSYLSFLPQQNAWLEQNPFPFKLVNLAIHLANTFLVFVLAQGICQKLATPPHHGQLIAGLCTLAWAISPMHINTVLYVIQRMTLLSTLFMLLAAIYFVRLPTGPASQRSWIWRAIVVWALYAIGILCKENAILIGMHLGVLLLTVTGRQHIPGWWIFSVLLLPLALTIAFLFADNRIVYGGRDFTLQQRLLTEAKIVLEYARKIIVAFPHEMNLFNDDYPVVNSIHDNPLALVSIAAIAIAFSLGVYYRKTYTVPAFAVLWFIAGHLLESTIIPLELYFEHRNYLPSFGLLFGLAWLAVTANRYRLLLWVAYGALLANALITTSSEISTWKSREQFAMSAILERPQSTRAIQMGAEFFLGQGDILKSATLVNYAHTRIKPYTSHLLYLLALKCLDDRVTLAAFPDVLTEIRHLPHDMNIKKATHDVFMVLQRQQCHYLNWRDYDTLLRTLEDKNPDSANYFRMHRILAYRLDGNHPAAMDTLETMEIGRGSIDQGFFKIYMLLEYGQISDARVALEALTERFGHTRAGWINRDEFDRLGRLTRPDPEPSSNQTD